MKKLSFFQLVTLCLLAALLVGCASPAAATATAPAPSTATVAAAPTATNAPAAPTPAPATAAPAATAAPTQAAASAETSFTLTWFGQSTFVLASSSGLRALLDPTASGTGYKIATQNNIDVVTISHEHSDHNAANLASGSPLVLHGLANNDWAKIDQTVKGVRIRSVNAYHDASQGKERGKNAIFIFELDGLRLAHVGDLGAVLNDEQVKAIGPIDVLLLPVGGYYTIDAKAAASVVGQLNPKVIVPMHYKTPALSASLAGVLAPVDAFLAAMGSAKVEQSPQTLVIAKSKLPAAPSIFVMKYEP